MAYTQTMSQQAAHQHYRDVQTPPTPPMQRRHDAKMRFLTDLSQCLFDFVIQLLPTAEEMAVKEDVRKLLERLIRTIEPESRLLSFGSTANGFSLRNSDMDLCCLIDSKERLAATDLVTMLGDLLERETKFHVKPLPHARIPIVKLSLDPSPGLPLGIACDIGFENRLALENTRLLMCYAMIDPTRVRTLVLFLKVWSKRRKINSPYKGTLSSYVLPNLQQMPPLRPISTDETHINGYNTWFFDDIELLRQRWHSDNTESVAELLIHFFRYYSREFAYNSSVASIRAGLLKKETKGWQSDSSGRFNDSRDRNRFCIEDPFEVDYNVARCVTKDGLYTIRGEFMRATRVLSTRPERAIIALAELCEERRDEDLVSAPPYNSHQMSLPPQTPYTVGSQSMRLKSSPATERLSPPAKFFEPGPRHSVSIRPPPSEQMPEHMAPKRSKWTSPPPAEASSADHSFFESELGKGLELATSSTEARELDASYNSSASSEFLTDEESRSDAAESDEIMSVRSYTESPTTHSSGSLRRPSWHIRDDGNRTSLTSTDAQGSGIQSQYQQVADVPAPASYPGCPPPDISVESTTLSFTENLKRSIGSHSLSPQVSSTNTSVGASIPLPPSPESPTEVPPSFISESSAVFYQTNVPRSPRPNILYPSPGSHSSILSQYQRHAYQNININAVVPPDIFPPNMPPSITYMNSHIHANVAAEAGRSSAGPETPTPATYSHSHSLSTNTITAPTPPPHATSFSPSTSTTAPVSSSPMRKVSRADSRSRSRSRSPPVKDFPTSRLREQFIVPLKDGESSPHRSSNGSSPAPSSTGYATSLSRSPSPHSPSPPVTAVPPKVEPSCSQEKPNGDTDLCTCPTVVKVSRAESHSLEQTLLQSNIKPTFPSSPR